MSILINLEIGWKKIFNVVTVLYVDTEYRVLHNII